MRLGPAPALALFVLAAMFLAAGPLPAEEAPRAMPFNKTSVHKYFVVAGALRQEMEEKFEPRNWTAETARIYVDTARHGGFDFEATVLSAMRGLDKSLDNPRFVFLSGVFQIHPDVYLKLGLIKRETRDAVTAFFK